MAVTERIRLFIADASKGSSGRDRAFDDTNLAANPSWGRLARARRRFILDSCLRSAHRIAIACTKRRLQRFRPYLKGEGEAPAERGSVYQRSARLEPRPP